MKEIEELIDRLEEDSYPPNDNGVALRELDFTELRYQIANQVEGLEAKEEELENKIEKLEDKLETIVSIGEVR